MTALVLTILAAIFALGAFACAWADRHIDSDPPMSRKREKAGLMREECRR